MKYTALILAVFMLFAVSFPGVANGDAVRAAVKRSCCGRNMSKTACSKYKDKQQKVPCKKEGQCSMMFSCSICGFFIAESLTVSHQLFCKIEKPVTPYISGELSDYNPSGRKPPQV